MRDALWVGPGAARALAGEGVVEIALHPGGYVQFGDGFVLVAHARAPRGPLSILVTGLESAPLRPADRARVDGAALHVGAHTIGLIPPAPPLDPGPLRPGWRAALQAALAACPEPPPALAGALRAGDLARLAGRGEGLTPAGDDVLAGYAAWRGAIVKGSDPLTMSPIGLAYLRCAERGELPEVVARVMVAIRAGDARAAAVRARALSRWGASSGAAMLWGMAAAA